MTGSFGGGGRGRGTCGWSVFDGVRAFPPTPEALMAEIDAAIAASEYVHATALLSSSSEEEPEKEKGLDTAAPVHDARLADEAYKAACAALAAGRPDAAIQSLRLALARCPPDKSSALDKLRSLLSIASSQLQKQQQHLQRKELQDE
ncbi:uncharacterized protein LOC103718672 isoform X1 [Phoenix dactylifera]|uniref:Uncharacterized protein LOC103718672 isoform X1 n=1 Tax=Phoenix dactylifera TaxID=42345 RepID=A0A8B9A817_PHODC|nr:uncharacterized protein LOC120107721 [Phoenix dactylifera]XP_038981842.1 uncharacterized protein LOC103718672 isoform X1 [Phoenix dactylifera]